MRGTMPPSRPQRLPRATAADQRNASAAGPATPGVPRRGTPSRVPRKPATPKPRKNSLAAAMMQLCDARPGSVLHVPPAAPSEPDRATAATAASSNTMHARQLDVAAPGVAAPSPLDAPCIASVATAPAATPSSGKHPPKSAAAGATIDPRATAAPARSTDSSAGFSIAAMASPARASSTTAGFLPQLDAAAGPTSAEMATDTPIQPCWLCFIGRSGCCPNSVWPVRVFTLASRRGERGWD